MSLLLRQVRADGRPAFDRLFPIVYAELRQLAGAQRRRWQGDETLNTTALVHEAYLRLAQQSGPDWRDRAHFFAAERLHALVMAAAPALSPTTWYGMPAYAKDGKVVSFFQSAQKFKTRYATFGLSDAANLDEGAFWPVAFALKEVTAAEEAEIGALLKRAVSVARDLRIHTGPVGARSVRQARTQAVERQTTGRQRMFKGINVVSISVPDLDEARRYYRDVLGLGEPIYDLPEAGWIEFGTGGAFGNIAVTKAEEDWKPATGTTVVLNVEDCEASWEELRRRGVRCDNPQVFPGYVTFCSFYDLFGNRLQMCSPAPTTEVVRS